MSKKDILILVVKVIIYACTLFLGLLGVTSLTSCTVTRDTSVTGKATIVTVDTTYIHHNTLIVYPKK